jgi:large subunit ribosomal protein L6
LFLQSQIKKLKKPVIKCLLFKGLGLKINALTDKFIDLKLGYSHNVKINIPKNIKVTRIKNFLLIEGINAALVGNFADFIKKKRLPDLYKGKGIFYKNETIKLKLIKKN